MNSKVLFFILTVLSPLSGFAATGGHGPVEMDEHWRHVIIYQAINVAMVVGGLIYFLRKPVIQFFADKRTQYFQAAAQTQAARNAAQHDYDQARSQLLKLETTTDESLQRAQAESAELRKNLIQDAQQAAQKIKEEAAATARFEVQRAIADLRAEMIREAVATTVKQMSSGVSQEDHQRLNKEFIRNIEAVQP